MKKLIIALFLVICIALQGVAALAVPGEIPPEAKVSAWAICNYLIRNFEPLYQYEVDITPELNAYSDSAAEEEGAEADVEDVVETDIAEAIEDAEADIAEAVEAAQADVAEAIEASEVEADIAEAIEEAIGGVEADIAEAIEASEVEADIAEVSQPDVDRTEIDFLLDYNAVSLVGVDADGRYTGTLFVYDQADFPAGLLRILLSQYGKLSTQYAREGETLVVVVCLSGGVNVPIADEFTAAAFLEGLENTDSRG